MARLFQIETLRALVAKALQEGSYAPGESARVRAVPDTRTIRYYTTLGLINTPARMRGRTAYYSEQHVLQLVAIKRLQAAGATLAEVQRKLFGLTPSKLQTIAQLPEGFWMLADGYLASLADDQLHEDVVPTPTRDTNAFWLATPALPGSPSASSYTAKAANSIDQDSDAAASNHTGSAQVRSVIRLPLPGSSSIQIELPSDAHANRTLDIEALMTSAQPLIEELRRQKLIDE